MIIAIIISHNIVKRSACTVRGFMQRLSTKLKYYSWHLAQRVSESDRSEKKYSTNNFKKYSNMQRELKTAKCISMDAFRYRFHIHNNLNYLLEHYLQLHSNGWNSSSKFLM